MTCNVFSVDWSCVSDKKNYVDIALHIDEVANHIFE